jgi:hypothetical protein
MSTSYSSVKYLGGIPSYPSKASVTLVIDENGIALRRWGRFRCVIRIEDITDLQIVPYLVAFPPATQDKSVLGRAAIGGLLLGPLGAVVGGMSGVGGKQKLTLEQQAHKDDFVLLVEGSESGLRYRSGFVFSALLFKQRAARRPHDHIQRLRAAAAQRRQLTGLGPPPAPALAASNPP